MVTIHIHFIILLHNDMLLTKSFSFFCIISIIEVCAIMGSTACSQMTCQVRNSRKTIRNSEISFIWVCVLKLWNYIKWQMQLFLFMLGRLAMLQKVSEMVILLVFRSDCLVRYE